MKLEMKKTVCIIAASIGMISGTFALDEAKDPIQQKRVGLQQKGEFEGVRIINKLIGFQVELGLNKDESIVVGEKSENKKDYSIVKGGAKKVNSLHFKITNLKSEKVIASGEIELDWITKDKADVLQEVMKQLKAIGITASVKEESGEAGNILVITIEKQS